MKKNVIIINNILLISLLTFSGCQKETGTDANLPTTVSNAATAKVAPSETQLLIRKWMEWVFTRDFNLAPWDDATGEKQYAAQPYPNGTMMLAGGSSPDLVAREITIDINQYQYVFLPLVNYLTYWNDCYPGHPDNGNVPNGALISSITEELNGKRNLILNWDGNSILPDKLKDLRGNSGFWELPIHSSWDGGCIASSTTFYADGFWVKIPLTVGVHQLEVGGDLDSRRFKFSFSNHVIYTITVTN